MIFHTPLALLPLADLFEKLLAMDAMLSFLMIEFADVRNAFSARRPHMPGYGKASLDHTSERADSSFDRSVLLGARIGMLCNERWE